MYYLSTQFNKYKWKLKRATALLLAVAMISGDFGSFAYAADNQQVNPDREIENLFEFPGSGTAEDPYILDGKTGLEQLA